MFTDVNTSQISNIICKMSSPNVLKYWLLLESLIFPGELVIIC